MRVQISLLTSEGNAFPARGFVNVFSNDTTGALTTGTKAYFSAAEAVVHCRPPAGCTREGTVSLADYLSDDTTSAAMSAAKSAAIEVLDLKLGALLGIKLHKVKPAKKTKVKAKAKAKKVSGRITRR